MSQLPVRAGRTPHGGYAILSRYALVLDIVAQAPGGLSLSDIGQRTDLPQATVYRLVHALAHVGFLAPGERRRHYVLGPRLLRLMPRGLPDRKVRGLAQPILAQLATAFGETAFIAKLDGNIVETVDVATPDGAAPALIQPGRLMPFHVAASAKVILAFADGHLYDDMLQRPPRQFTPRTKTDREEIASELARIREQGFAMCDQELDAGVVSYACPVKTGTGAVIYSMGLVGFAERLGRAPVDAIVSSLKSAAGDFSAVLREEHASVPDRLPNWNPGLAPSYRNGAAAIDR